MSSHFLDLLVRLHTVLTHSSRGGEEEAAHLATDIEGLLKDAIRPADLGK